MEISADKVRDLREKTGAGIMDCKRALAENSGDMGKALNFLREKGLASAQKKAGRAASDGLIASYVHAGGKVGVLAEINCETDFVAKTGDFQGLAKDIALHVAAMNPLYVAREDVPADVVAQEKEIYRAQAKGEGKPDKVLDKIVEGKLERYYKDVCLLEQAFVKNSDHSVADMITAAIAKLGENIRVRRFSRFKVGEGAGVPTPSGAGRPVAGEKS